MGSNQCAAPTPSIFPRKYSDSRGKDGLKRDARSQPSTNPNPGELPSFSMRDLGASPTVKFVVYTVLGVMGTLETYAYGKWAWYKWGPKPDDADQVQEGS
jgi:hypothetical protein